MKRKLSAALIVCISFSATAEVSRDCSNRQNVTEMINELKEAFECAGLSASDCKKLVAGSIGGPIAARMAVGLSAMKRTPVLQKCMLDWGNSAANTQNINLNFFSQEAYASIPSGALHGCKITKTEFGRDLNILAHEYGEQAEEIRQKMALRLTEDKLQLDLSKIVANDKDIQQATLTKLREFQKAIENPVVGKKLMGDEVSLKIIREQTRNQIEILAKESENLIGAAQSANERIFFSIPEDTRIEWEQKFSVNRTIREQTAQKIENERGSKALKTFEKALKDIDDLEWQNEKVKYLQGLGYSEKSVSDILSVERNRKDLKMIKNKIYYAHNELMRGATIKGSSTLDPSTMRNFMMKHLPHIGYRLPIPFMAEVPGAALRLQGKIMALGRSQLAASTRNVANLKSGLGVLAKVGEGAARFAGGTAATLGTISTNVFAVDCKNTGDRESPYVSLEPTTSGNCAPTSQRTELTDSFLFGLNSDEQWQMAKSDAQTCSMLNRAHERYAPSRQWEIDCPKSDRDAIVLKSKMDDENQPRLRFNAKNDGEPNHIDWIIPAQNSCVSVVNGKAKIADVYTIKNRNQDKCEIMDAGDMDSYQPASRPLNRDFARQFAGVAEEWVKTNNYTFVASSLCCSGQHSPLCPSKSKLLNTKRTNNGTSK